MGSNLIIILLLVVGAIILVSGRIIDYFMRDYILQNGVQVEGRIIEHRDAIKLFSRQYSHSHQYFLTYLYEYQGKTYVQEQQVSLETYERYPDQTAVNVRCLSNHPTRAMAVDL